MRDSGVRDLQVDVMSETAREGERKVLTRIDRQTHAVVRKEGGEGPTGMSGWREDGDDADGDDGEDQQE